MAIKHFDKDGKPVYKDGKPVKNEDKDKEAIIKKHTKEIPQLDPNYPISNTNNDPTDESGNGAPAAMARD